MIRPERLNRKRRGIKNDGTVKSQFSSDFARSLNKSLFLCVVGDLATLSPEYIERHGIPTTGDRTADARIKNRTVRIRIPITLIIEYMEQGIDIRFPIKDEVLLMYKYCDGYIHEWIENLETSYNSMIGDRAPFLLSLAEFTSTIHEFLARNKLLEEAIEEEKSFGRLNPIYESTVQYQYISYRETYERFVRLVRDKVKQERTH